ncbi:hypothetical protein DL95DRAFT_384832 [Leptodontidium sp. 2 PMI_412]|nr:hypothetical protein DL95DRAFT_384832 [Leptodontidium sp. 2 PMI_412]
MAWNGNSYGGLYTSIGEFGGTLGQNRTTTFYGFVVSSFSVYFTNCILSSCMP